MRRTGATIYKSLCGLLVTLLLVLPLPALAEGQAADQPAPNTPTASSAPAAEIPAATASLSADSDLSTPAAGDAPQAGQTTGSAITAAPAPAPAPTPAPASGIKIGNTVTAASTSGDASVSNNQVAGDATSGNATASATVLNVANSNGLSVGQFHSFACDITDDLQQNITIDPATLMPLPYCKDGGVSNGVALQQPAGASGGLQTGGSMIDILNAIVLSANSGNATVDANTAAGNASTGNAAALANVVNIANTAITSRNSFLGVINIYSQLKGNILVPRSFVDSLVGNASGSGSVGNTTISNTINAAANSGDATIDTNKTAGNATTGEATTSLTVLNLTGQEVVARNSLLVFVNVLGKWMGLIVPAGTGNANSTALLGGSVQSSSASGLANQQANLTGSSINITNDITVQAQSGAADVSHNGSAGNATSGKASSGANLLNITDSKFWLQDWFGALFINVLGSWLGDFDIQAEAPASAVAGQGQSTVSSPVQAVRVYRFAAPAVVTPTTTVATSDRTGNSSGSQVSSTNAAVDVSSGKVLSSTAFRDAGNAVDSRQTSKTDNWGTIAVIMSVTVLAAVSATALKRHFAA